MKAGVRINLIFYNHLAIWAQNVSFLVVCNCKISYLRLGKSTLVQRNCKCYIIKISKTLFHIIVFKKKLR